MDSVMDIESL